MYLYTWHDWLAFFYFYCFFGWCFESTYVSLKERHLVNRGFLRGPMIPIYGSGAIVMLFVSAPYKDTILPCFISGMVGATLLEYVTGVVMERLFKVRYWDYSDQKLNYEGYICLSSSLAWGLLTVFMNKVLHHFVEEIVFSIPDTTLTILVLITTALFSFDVVNSVRAALSLARILEAMNRVRGSLEEVQLQLALLGAQVKDESSKHMHAIQSAASERKEHHLIQLEEFKTMLEGMLSHITADAPSIPELSSISEKLSSIKLPTIHSTKLIGHFVSGLLRGNSGASSKYHDALEEMMKRANSKHTNPED